MRVELCPACLRMAPPMPASGPLEHIEPITWEHDPNCALVLDSVADEPGPWNARLTPAQARAAVDYRPPEKQVRRHPDRWPSARRTTRREVHHGA